MSSESPSKRNRTVITRELYDRLVVAFRELPNNPTHAARSACTTLEVAKRAWGRGWADERSSPRLPWAHAVEKVLLEEKAAARQAMVEAERKKLHLDDEAYKEAQLEKFRASQADLTESRALRGQSVRASRHVSMAMLKVSLGGMRAAQDCLGMLTERMQSGEWKPSNAELRQTMRDMVFIARAATDNAKVTDEMESKALGEPDAFIMHAAAAGADVMTDAQAQATIIEAYKAVQRAKGRGTLEDAIDVEALQQASDEKAMSRYTIEPNDVLDGKVEGNGHS